MTRQAASALGMRLVNDVLTFGDRNMARETGSEWQHDCAGSCVLHNIREGSSEVFSAIEK